MNDFSADLEQSILAAYGLALRAKRLDVSELLLQALERLAQDCPQVEESVASAYLMIGSDQKRMKR